MESGVKDRYNGSMVNGLEVSNVVIPSSMGEPDLRSAIASFMNS